MDNNITRDETMNVHELMAQRNAQLEQQAQGEQYQHGDYIPGEGGFLIDSQEVMRKQTEIPQVNEIKKYIDNQNQQIQRLRNGESPASVMGETGTDRTEQDISDNSAVQHRVEIDKVRKAFDKFEMSSTGLAPAGSSAAKEFKQKMDDLESGKVNLEDYRDVPRQNNRPQQDMPVQQVAPRQEVVETEPNIVQFNVDANNSKNFISTLDKSDRQRIQKASTIVVNEIKTLNIPTTTRVISNMNEYKRIVPRSIFTDTIDCVLPNSGYVATVKGCGALAMAVLIPELNNGPDMSKRYQFCYDNLVTTSIGKLSLQEFITHTSANDLNILLFNILRASEPDEQTVTLTCGASSCAKDYDVKYKVSELLDTDTITDELANQIESIVKARDIYENAQAKHKESPVMVAKYMQVDYPDKTVIVELKSPDGSVAIERLAILSDIAKSYSHFIVGLLMYIPRVYVTFAMAGETNPATYEITDPFAIAETISELNDSSVHAITTLITEMPSYDAMTYSFKGQYKCPHCGRIETRVPCELEKLIFFKVQKAMQ